MPNINPTNLIPNEFYKQAAEICDRLPDIHFADIARVLYERDMYLRHNLTLVDAQTGKPVDNIKDILDPRNNDKVASTANIPDKKPRDRFTPLKRKSRHTRVQITFADGKTFAYPSRKDLILMNGFSGALYDSVFPHNIKDNEKYLKFEAKSVSELFANANKPIVEYVCYDFDNKRRAFKTGDYAKKESEAVNV